jgi:hypothetical protein
MGSPFTGSRFSSKAVVARPFQSRYSATMSDEASPRRTRITVDVWRRDLTEEERERHEQLMAAHPEVNYLPIDEAWGWKLDFLDDPEEVEPNSARGKHSQENEWVPLIIASIRRSISTELALRFRHPVVPLHPRLRRLLGASPKPDDAEVASCVARLLDLKAPESPAYQELLVLMALIAQGWYDDPWASYDELDLGQEIVGRISERMPSGDFAAALDELGVKDEVEASYVAAKLVKDKMGFSVDSRS